jgi:hypothetical protein
MTKAIGSPIKAEALKTYEIDIFGTLVDQAELTQEVFDRWLGYSESRIFGNANDVKYRYNTYLPYLKTASEDVQNIALSIIYELKTYPDKYDLTGIVMALAQNGGICNVQKEVGLRMVYASMTDSILQHVTATSLETSVLILLQNLRETLSERTAEKIIRSKSYEMNTHYLISVRNRLASSIGLTTINDPNAYTVPEMDYLEEFMKWYTLDEVMNCMRRALNESPRKMDYLIVLEFLEKHKPDDIDGYVFKQEFLFDDQGHFTDSAIRLMLLKMEIFKLPVNNQEAHE